MSTGFRLFLLMLLGFGAVWIYHLRSSDIAFWLEPAPAVLSSPPPPAFVQSPLEATVGLEEANSLTMTIQGVSQPPLPVPPAPPSPSPSPRWGNSLYGSERSAREFDGSRRWSDPSTVAEPHDEVWGLEDDGWLAERSARLGADDIVADEPFPLEEAVPEPPRQPAPRQPALEPEPEPEPERPAAGRYTVVEGDDLWSIAARTLGKGRRYREIVEINQALLGGSETIRPGMVLAMPPR